MHYFLNIELRISSISISYYESYDFTTKIKTPNNMIVTGNENCTSILFTFSGFLKCFFIYIYILTRLQGIQSVQA